MATAPLVDQLWQIISFALFPLIAAIVGAVIAARHPPGAGMRSNIQHLAAGVVFSVVAVEILPDVTHRQHPLLLTIGFSLGVALMLGLEWYSGHAEKGEGGDANSSSNLSLFAALGLDVFLDGLLIAISFKAGANAGKLLALALSVELLSTALALSSTLSRQGISFMRNVGTNAAIFSLLVVGAAVGAWFSPYLEGVILDLILSFGLAALLFLVTEELLVEAHKEPETPFSTALFFIGFLAFLLLGMAHPT